MKTFELIGEKVVSVVTKIETHSGFGVTFVLIDFENLFRLDVNDYFHTVMENKRVPILVNGTKTSLKGFHQSKKGSLHRLIGATLLSFPYSDSDFYPIIKFSENLELTMGVNEDSLDIYLVGLALGIVEDNSEEYKF